MCIGNHFEYLIGSSLFICNALITTLNAEFYQNFFIFNSQENLRN